MVIHRLHQLTNGTPWDGLADYYTRERGLPIAAAKRAVEALSHDGGEKEAWLKAAREALSAYGNDAIGSIGEAHLSYALELGGNLALVHAGWKNNPLAVVQGIDLIGVRLNDATISFVEVKTSTANTRGIKDLTLDKLSKQLKLSRLEILFRQRAGVASPPNIAHALQSVIRRRRLDFPDERIQKLLQADGFERIGGVVAGQTDPWHPISAACPCDLSPTRPCSFELLVVEALVNSIEKLTAIEVAALA